MLKFKFDNYGCRHSHNDDTMGTADVTLGWKCALVVGYGDVGKGCVFALRDSGSRVFAADCDPIDSLGEIQDHLLVRWFWWSLAMVPFCYVVFKLMVGLRPPASRRPARQWPSFPLLAS